MLDNVGQFIQILISLVTLILAIIRGIPEVQKAINDRQMARKVDKATDQALLVNRAPSRKHLDLAIVLICSAYYSLVIIDSVVVSGRNPEPLFSLIATLVVSILVTGALSFLWYRNKAELGIGWGAIITLLLLIIAPGGVFSPGEKGGVAGVNFWLPVPILTLLAMTMWIYEYGHPLDRTLPAVQRTKSVLVVSFIVLLSTVSLGKQFQSSILNDQLGRTPGTPSVESRKLLDSTNQWTRAQKSNFYAAASDIHLISNYFNLYQSIENLAVSTEEERKDLIVSNLSNLSLEIGISTQQLQLISAQEYEAIANEIINILRSGGGEEKIAYYLSTFINRALASSTEELFVSKELTSTDYQAIEDYSITIYNNQITSTLRILDVDEAFNAFTNLPREQQKLFMANRLKWIHAAGGKDRNLTTIALPGITPEARFKAVTLMMIDHTLPSQSSRLLTLCAEFNYEQSISEKYCPSSQNPLPLKLINPFDTRTVDNVDIRPVSIFSDFEPSYSKKPLLEQLSFPTDYEAYLALREYMALSRNLILDEEQQSSRRAIVEEALNQFDELDPQTQIAFIYYFTNFHEGDGDAEITSQDIYDAILKLKEEGIDPVDSDGNQLGENDMRILSDIIQQGTEPDQLPDNSLRPIAWAILKMKSQDDQERIRNLLKIRDPDIPVRYLLSVPVFELTSYLNSKLTNDQRNNFLEAVRNPIAKVVPSLLETKILFSDKDFSSEATPTEKEQFITEVKKTFENFKALSKEQQAVVLHRLAISLYDAKGPYSHNIFGLIITQANSWSEAAGLTLASILYLPLVLLIVVFASYTSKQLGGRDRLYQLLFDESSQPENWHFTVGAPDIIHGREKLIRQLKNLASRGWGSIAVVGRRGVGKTRILLEMLKRGNPGEMPQAISAWISTPSRFEESELIESVLERMTANAENAIAKHLGAKPLEIRRLEMNLTIIGAVVYIVSWVVLGATFIIMSERVSSDQITSTWFPIFLVSVISTITLCMHWFNLQPLDLSAWLERDRSSSPHTVLLYRDAKRVLRFLENRKKIGMRDSDEGSFVLSFLRWAGILISAAASFVTIANVLTNFGDSTQILLAILSLLVFCGLVAAQYNAKRHSSQGFSLLSLIAEYRGFVDRAVFRIRHGALGSRQEEDFEIIVCIDELDKIIVPSELLAYLRRMKVIFEIPGAYYFLSISEDALRALYLGAAEGKNEIDSTFDHIIRIPPVDCNLGEEIASAYLNKHSNKPRDERIDRTIAAVSYGIPRDIIRRCDEILANEDFQNIKALFISDTFRKMQVEIAYSERLLTREQFRDFGGKADDALNAISSFVNKNSSDDNEPMAVVLSLWVLSLISVITTLREDSWRAYLEVARDIGYRILGEQPVILIEELNELQKKVIAEKTN